MPLEKSITLLGYEAAPQPARSGEVLNLTLYWQTTATIEFPYTVFNHLVAPDGTLVAQQDGMPQQNQLPTPCWQPGEVITDAYSLALPADLPAGRYTLLTGLYDPLTGQRLLLQDGSRGDAIVLGEVVVVERP